MYFDASKNRWIGATSLGFSPDGERRIRQKVSGRTKAEVRDKLRALHRDLEAGLPAGHRPCTAERSAARQRSAPVDAWARRGLHRSLKSVVPLRISRPSNWRLAASSGRPPSPARTSPENARPVA